MLILAQHRSATSGHVSDSGSLLPENHEKRETVGALLCSHFSASTHSSLLYNIQHSQYQKNLPPNIQHHFSS